MTLDVSSVRAVLDGSARWCSLVGDVRQRLRDVPDGCVQTCVTSPPYFGLRDYGNAAQIGQEHSPLEFVDALVAVFAEVRRVLADDGTCWINLGDSYAATTKGSSGKGEKQRSNAGTLLADRRWKVPDGLKPKDLMGIPWRVAFALQDAGWWLRSDIIWSKPNPMPESVTDRPTRAHEYVFLLTKSARYFYDADAVRETPSANSHGGGRADSVRYMDARIGASDAGLRNAKPAGADGRNARSVWTITPEPYAGAHFATMPPELARRCILAGSRKGDVVLDPFFGAATTGLVALQHGRRTIGCELNPDYVALQRERLAVFDADAVSAVSVAAPSWGPLFGGAR